MNTYNLKKIYFNRKPRLGLVIFVKYSLDTLSRHHSYASQTRHNTPLFIVKIQPHD